MALQLVCDACGAVMQQETAQAFGRLDPAYYCPTCAEEWMTAQREIEDKRRQLITDFEQFRKVRLKALPHLKRPDGD